MGGQKSPALSKHRNNVLIVSPAADSQAVDVENHELAVVRRGGPKLQF